MIIGNQKTKLAFWIIEHLNKENQLTMTQRQIAQKSGISLDTVRLTMKALLESNFLVKQNIGVYMVNPDVVFKGGKTDRLNILIQYRKTGENENENENEEEPKKRLGRDYMAEREEAEGNGKAD